MGTLFRVAMTIGLIVLLFLLHPVLGIGAGVLLLFSAAHGR